MDVNRYVIRQPVLSTTTATTINLPVSQTLALAGQQEIIDTKFIDVEVEESINGTFDYETVRFTPQYSGITCDTITYSINLLDTNGNYPATTWFDAGFDFDDFYFRKNAFTKSFLRLDFYDSDIGTNQRLLFFKTIYPNIDSTTGQIPQPINLPLNFNVGNVLKDRSLNGEGFFIYYFKDEVIPTGPKELYMRATFLNAKNGKATSMMSSNDPDITIDVLAKTAMNQSMYLGKLYTKYVLTRGLDGYYYEIDKTYSGRVLNGVLQSNITSNINPTSYRVNLYQISVS